MTHSIKVSVRALALLFVFSCNDIVVVDGVKVDHTLYENLTLTERTKLKGLIHRTVDLDHNALSDLVNFDCGGAAGCYDLGFVMTQIIHQVGETRFLPLLSQQTDQTLQGLRNLIEVGLEYGDNDKDGKLDNTTVERAFPSLSQQIQTRLNQ